jgi:hypothetical protein
MNHSKALLRGAALSLAALFVFASVGVAAPSEVWRTRLSGKSEVPPNDSKAHGSALFRLVRDAGSTITAIEYEVRVSNLEDLQAGHIHSGAEGVAGPVVVDLHPRTGAGRAQGVIANGTITASDLVGPLTGMTLEDLYELFTSGEAYVNLHTTSFPGGEIRGQLSARGGSN